MKLSLGLLVVVVLLACDSRTTLDPIAEQTKRSSPTLSDDPTEVIATGLAQALGDRTLSRQLRDALRSSPFNEHKLVLSDFLKSEAGKSLLRKAADAVETSESQFLNMVHSLPELDFYMPFRSHRVSWRGTPDVLVTVVLDEATEVARARDSQGRVVLLDSSQGPHIQAVLVAHPAEYKSKRIDRRGVGGSTVQDPDESEETESEVVIESRPQGSLGLHQECIPGEPG